MVINMKKNTIIITVVLVIIVGAGAFWGGTKYQQSRQASVARQFAGGQGGRMGQGQGNRTVGLRPVDGEIISSDASSITVKLADGSSKIVILSDNTQISQSSTAGKSDLKVGEKVAVFGQQNSDGSITAQTVQLNPILRDFPLPTPS